MDKNEDDQSAFDEYSQPISIDHEEGTLAPYESKLITVSYVPTLARKGKNFATTHKADDDIAKMRLLLVIESKDKIVIPLNGVEFPVLYEISKRAFDFGDCAVSDRRDLYCELKWRCAITLARFSALRRRPRWACCSRCSRSTVCCPLCPSSWASSSGSA